MQTTRGDVVLANPSARALILFDGVCNLCHATVRFVIARDPDKYFCFASLQSSAGQRIARQFDVPAGSLDSMLLIENGKLYRRSTAALRIARKLRLPWPLLSVCLILPAGLRDPVYNYVGQRRYSWFGQRDLCAISDPGAAERFLE